MYQPCSPPFSTRDSSEQSVTFVKILIRMNIFISIFLIRTNVWISIRIENCMNIFEYSSRFYTLTHSPTNVRIYSFKFDTKEYPNIFVTEKLIRTNVRIYIRDQYIRISEYSNIFVTLCFREVSNWKWTVLSIFFFSSPLCFFLQKFFKSLVSYQLWTRDSSERCQMEVDGVVNFFFSFFF